MAIDSVHVLVEYDSTLLLRDETNSSVSACLLAHSLSALGSWKYFCACRLLQHICKLHVE